MTTPPKPLTPQEICDQAFIAILKGQRNAYADECARAGAQLEAANAHIRALEQQLAERLPTLPEQES